MRVCTKVAVSPVSLFFFFFLFYWVLWLIFFFPPMRTLVDFFFFFLNARNLVVFIPHVLRLFCNDHFKLIYLEVFDVVNSLFL